jgi:hypothetical protein
MASFDKLREALKELSFESHGADSRNNVEVEAYSIEEGLQKASELLGVNISDLEYEIVEHGKKSFLSRRPYRLFVSITPEQRLPSSFDTLSESPKIRTDVLKRDSDGVYRVKVSRIGVVLKVTPPKGKGQRVRVEDILVTLKERGITRFDKSKIAAIVRSANGEYTKIGDYVPDERNDGRVVIEVSEDEMKAFMTLIPPKPRGRDIDIDDVMEAMSEKGISVGIKEDTIRKTIEEGVYNVLIPVAEGIKPVNGQDARVVYNFRIE